MAQQEAATGLPPIIDNISNDNIVPRLAPEARAVMEWASRGGGLPAEMQAKRRAFDAVFAELGGAPGELRSITDRMIPGPGGDLPVRIYRDIEGPLPALIYYHGGGFEKGGLASHDAGLRILARECRCLVVSVAYRLAPEHKFPSQIDDALAALRWVHGNAAAIGADAARLAVGGDSVGGNLAAVTAQRASKEGGPRLAAQVLFYPVTDATLSSESWRRFAAGPWLTRAYEENALQRQYLPAGQDPRDPRVSPLFAADLTGLPPAFVIDAEFDGYRDEGQAYATKMKAAGVPVTAAVYPGMIHDFVFMPGRLEAARRALAEAGAFLARSFDAAASR